VASRPLHVKELAEFLAIDFTARPIPKFYEHRRRKVDAVLSMCSNLLSVDCSSVVQFSDPSVEEYLTSPHLSYASDDTTSPLYHVFKTPAHTRAAQACLAILLHLGNDITEDSLQKYPLARYAAEHWIDHAQFEYVQQDVEEGLRCLFDPSKRHFAVSIWIHDPVIPAWRRTDRGERPSQPCGTHLYYAAHYGLHDIVKYLIIEHSLDVHSRGFDESTPLHVASSRGHMEVTRILLYYDGDTTAQDELGRTPLYEASYGGHVQVARILLKYGADAMAQDEFRVTPLHLACRRGHVQVARILLEHGADAKAKGKRGWTPLHEASSTGHMELVRILLEHGADMKTQDGDGRSPNREAPSGGHVGAVRMLLEHGADVNAQDENGSTLLHMASTEGRADVVLLLLEHGARTTIQNNMWYTPLHLACERGHVEVSRALLKHGADAAAQNGGSSTPLHAASWGGVCVHRPHAS
jgi:ankyrin repeat protein